MLIGFGAFNVVEGIIDHHLLGVHHVNERIDRAYWLYWDLAFILWGASMLATGWWLLRQGQRDTAMTAGKAP
jgi:uncharacterized membrane protein